MMYDVILLRIKALFHGITVSIPTSIRVYVTVTILWYEIKRVVNIIHVVSDVVSDVTDHRRI